MKDKSSISSKNLYIFFHLRIEVGTVGSVVNQKGAIAIGSDSFHTLASESVNKVYHQKTPVLDSSFLRDSGLGFRGFTSSWRSCSTDDWSESTHYSRS